MIKGEKGAHFPGQTRPLIRKMLCATSVNHLETMFYDFPEPNGRDRHGFCEVEFGKGRHAPKCDSSTGFRFAMSDGGRPEQATDNGVVADARPACVALVPVAQQTEWTRTAGQPCSRPASTFVAQLLATAEHAPQTRSLRRATAADAQTAYGAHRQAAGTGIRTRQVI